MSLDAWLEAQEKASAAHIAAAVSATGLRHHRPVFDITITPAPGSVLASPEPSLWDPEPDYFYHWARDAGVVMLVAPVLRERDAAAGWERRFAEYVRFSHLIATRAGPAKNPLRATTPPEHQRFLRPDDELAALTGDDALLNEPRANADGTVDVERWSRPQFDGPALRALSCLAWDGPVPAGMDALLALDLGHVLRHAALPTIGPWEEEPAALHVFTLLAQRAALRAGAAGRLAPGPTQSALARIEVALDTLWNDAGGHMRASTVAAPGDSDANVILGALLCAPEEATFGIDDPRIVATAAHVERWSAEAYGIVSAEAPLVGRWPGDVFFGGNPWLPTSFGFAEFYYRRATRMAARQEAAETVARGDAFLAAVSRHIPEPGPLPEQLDKATGAPVSSRNLTWSHAALIAAAEARRNALRRLG